MFRGPLRGKNKQKQTKTNRTNTCAARRQNKEKKIKKKATTATTCVEGKEEEKRDQNKRGGTTNQIERLTVSLLVAGRQRGSNLLTDAKVFQ